MTDETTFFLSFLTVFGALAWYMWRLNRHINALETKLNSTTAKKAD